MKSYADWSDDLIKSLRKDDEKPGIHGIDSAPDPQVEAAELCGGEVSGIDTNRGLGDYPNCPLVGIVAEDDFGTWLEEGSKELGVEAVKEYAGQGLSEISAKAGDTLLCVSNSGMGVVFTEGKEYPVTENLFITSNGGMRWKIGELSDSLFIKLDKEDSK